MRPADGRAIQTVAKGFNVKDSRNSCFHYAHGTKQRTDRCLQFGSAGPFQASEIRVSETRGKCTAPQGADSATSRRRMHRRADQRPPLRPGTSGPIQLRRVPRRGTGVRRDQVLQPRIGPAPSGRSSLAYSRTLLDHARSPAPHCRPGADSVGCRVIGEAAEKRAHTRLCPLTAIGSSTGSTPCALGRGTSTSTMWRGRPIPMNRGRRSGTTQEAAFRLGRSGRRRCGLRTLGIVGLPRSLTRQDISGIGASGHIQRPVEQTGVRVFGGTGPPGCRHQNGGSGCRQRVGHPQRISRNVGRSVCPLPQ